MDLQQKDAKGVRQDLSDVIIELEAEKTPAFSIIPKGKRPGAPVMMQPVDLPGFASRRGVKNKTPARPVTDQSKKYNLLESCNHMLTLTVGVGEKDEATANRAGVGMGKLYAREVRKGLQSMKTAIECITLDNEDQRDEGDVGSETRGGFSWASPDKQACRPVPDDYRPSAAQRVTTKLANITPDDFRKALDARWQKTKEKAHLYAFCGNELQAHVSSWSMYIPDKDSHATVRRFDQPAAAGKKERALAVIINMLEFDTGTVEMHLDPYLLWDRAADEDYQMPEVSTRSALMFPKDAMSYHFAKPVEHRKLNWDGGSESGQISTIFHTMARPWDMISIMPAA